MLKFGTPALSVGTTYSKGISIRSVVPKLQAFQMCPLIKNTLYFTSVLQLIFDQSNVYIWLFESAKRLHSDHSLLMIVAASCVVRLLIKIALLWARWLKFIDAHQNDGVSPSESLIAPVAFVGLAPQKTSTSLGCFGTPASRYRISRGWVGWFSDSIQTTYPFHSISFSRETFLGADARWYQSVAFCGRR